VIRIFFKTNLGSLQGGKLIEKIECRCRRLLKQKVSNCVGFFFLFFIFYLITLLFPQTKIYLAEQLRGCHNGSTGTKSL